MSALRTRAQDADVALAGRDPDLPCLPAVLDDGRLSDLMGEDVRITRVRYKPHTSALVAFTRTRDGRAEPGWAVTRAADPGAKLAGRAAVAAGHGGNVRFLRPDPADSEAFIAVGEVAHDWPLRKNLRWLASEGLARLGAVPRPGQLLDGTARVLRYNPERRLVLLEPVPGAAMVIKTAAQPIDEAAGRWLQERLQAREVPVLPWLGDAHCSRRGTRASPAWGSGDLAAVGTELNARHAGQALARLHGIPGPGSGDGPGDRHGYRDGPEAASVHLAATLGMVTVLVPELEAAATRLADRLRSRLNEVTAGTAPVLVHGDFSADQVLVSGTDIRLIDFDRARSGAAEADLGSFAAVEEVRRWKAEAGPGPYTDELLEGYGAGGGRFTPAAVPVWAAYRLFCNSVDPFRDRAPGWSEVIARHIDRAAELVR